MSSGENSRKASTKGSMRHNTPLRTDMSLPRNYDPNALNDSSDLPPSYEEAVGKKYAKDEYPSDEKRPIGREDSSKRSKMPPAATLPRRAKTVRVSSRSRRNAGREGLHSNNRSRENSNTQPRRHHSYYRNGNYGRWKNQIQKCWTSISGWKELPCGL